MAEQAEHYVDVGTHIIPGRHALYAAECRQCGWRSREYRDFDKACEKADEHSVKFERIREEMEG